MVNIKNFYGRNDTFAVIDIIGSVPIIIELRKKVGHIQSEKASIVSVVIMIAFLFIEEILNIIGIDVNSFAVAGICNFLYLSRNGFGNFNL